MRRAARLARDECPSPRFAARYRTRLTGLVTRYGRREGDPFAPASNSSEAVVLEPSLAPRVAQPRALASGSQTSARPPAKPKALKPIDSRATLPVRMIKVGPGNLAAIFLLDRPQETARLVEIRVVRQPFNGAMLLAGAGAAAAVGDAV